MTGMLASVRDREEAKILTACEIDILDLKDPNAGALGALPTGLVKSIVNEVNGRIPVSATVGDVPCRADVLYPKINAMAGAGVDLVKIGVFGDVSDPGVLDMLKDFSRRHVRLVLVLFAEDMPHTTGFDVFAGTGITGVMLDTREKATGTLRKKVSDQDLLQFVHNCKQAGLLCGLAGSLGVQDIGPLLRLQPDYLGFRGALCRDSRRGNHIDVDAVMRVRTLISGPGVPNFDKDAITV